MREQRVRYIFLARERGKLLSGHSVYDNVPDVVFPKLYFYLMSKLAFNCGFTLFEQENLEITMYQFSPY